MRTLVQMVVFVVFVVFVLMASCARSSEPDGGVVSDSGNDADTVVEDAAVPEGLDVLFVVREKGGIRALRESLLQALPAIVDRWQRDIPSLHIAVVGTDLGLRQGANRNCSERGTEGVLRHVGGIPSAPSFVTNMDSPTTLLGLIGGDEGDCGLEQPLEASLMSLSGPDEVYRFYGDSRFEGELGRGSENAGFRRMDVPLVLIVITEDDDCSFIRGDFHQFPRMNPRVLCATSEGVLHPPEQYAEAWRRLAPEGLHVFVLAGVPSDIIGQPLAQVLADERMVPRAEGVDGNELAPACENDNLGALFPPRRLVQFANEVDAHPSSAAKVLSACDPESVREAWPQLEEFVLEAASHN